MQDKVGGDGLRIYTEVTPSSCEDKAYSSVVPKAGVGFTQFTANIRPPVHGRIDSDFQFPTPQWSGTTIMG